MNSTNEVKTRNGLYGFEYLAVDKRRTEEGETRTHNIQALWQRSHEIINLAAKGYKNVEIAEILNIHPGTVSNTLNSDLGRMKLSEIRKGRDEEAKKTVEKIRTLTNKALNVYHEIFDGESSLKDKKAVADTVTLELSGLRAPTRIQSQSVNMNLTPEELERFKERGIQAAREAGMVVDVEPEQSDTSHVSVAKIKTESVSKIEG